MTSQPLNQSELQLYRVLQRANLLAYYDTFICQGGDDVQQLCEAGEDEFLEIMALVGMASKPLHVRRLQKALQEWVKNPDMFTGPPPAGFASGPHLSHQNGTGNAPPPPPPALLPSTGLPAPIAASVDGRSPSGPNGSSCIPSLNLGSNSVSPRRESMAAALGAACRSRSDRQASSSASIGSTSGALSPINFSTPPFVGNPGTNSGPNGNTCVPHITSPTGVGHSSSLSSGGPNHSGHSGGGGGGSGGGGGGVLQSNCPSGGTSSHSTPSPTAKESNNHFTPNSLSLALSMAQHQVNQDRNRERMRVWMEGQAGVGQHVVNDSNQPAPFSLGPSNTREGLITNEYGQPASPVSLTPVLLDSQIQRLADAAESLIKALPPSLDVKLTSNKKRISKELEHVLNMAEDDPRRLDEIRKYAAIYGRFDCKRKPEKPLTLHEVSVNEAAAQICKHIPALLTRRDELFPLARQVVRDSGYQYSKGHSRSQSNLKRTLEEAGLVSNNGCNKFFNSSTSNDTSKVDTDDTDSQYSLYSNPSESQSNDAAESNGQQGPGGSIHCPPMDVTCGTSNGNENFSKLLPAKKSGNFGGAAQIAKQLVQETLLDEGLRVVKEFTGGNSNGSDDCINSSSNGGPSGSGHCIGHAISSDGRGRNGGSGVGGENGSNSSNSSNSNDGTSPSPPKKESRNNSLSSPGNSSSSLHHPHHHHSLAHVSLHQMDLDGPNGASALITGEGLPGHSSGPNSAAHLLSGNVNASVLFSNGHILPPGPPPAVVMSHRPRGRPPKAMTDLRNLEAAYHEKLTQHLQQSFLASQAYNQVIQAAAVAAAANGFTSATTSPSNGGGHSNAASIGALVTGATLQQQQPPPLNGDLASEGNRSLKAEQLDNQVHHSIQMSGDIEPGTGQGGHLNHGNHSGSSVTRTNGFHSQPQGSKDLSMDGDILSVTDLSVNSTSTLSTRPPVTSSPNLSASEGENNATSTSSHFTDH